MTDTREYINVAEALATEIARVSALRERYRAMRGMPQVNVEPAIWMMTAALESATRASGTNDAVECIRALEDLRGFEK